MTSLSEWSQALAWIFTGYITLWWAISYIFRRRFGLVVVGITGGRCAGKSTVASRLVKRHLAPHINLDDVEEKLATPGLPLWTELVRCFAASTGQSLSKPGASSLLGPNWDIDRSHLEHILCESPKNRLAYNALILPKLKQHFLLALAKVFLWDQLGGPVVIVESGLLYELKLNAWCDYVLSVSASPSTRMKRLKDQRPDLSTEQIRDMLTCQMPQNRINQFAHWTLDNDKLKKPSLHEDVDRWWEIAFTEIAKKPHYTATVASSRASMVAISTVAAVAILSTIARYFSWKLFAVATGFLLA